MLSQAWSILKDFKAEQYRKYKWRRIHSDDLPSSYKEMLNPAAGFLLHISDTTGGRTFVEVLWRWGAESKWGSSTKKPIRGEWVHVFYWIGYQTKKGEGDEFQ